jgi:methionyl-tRNA formyltransferase
MKKRAVLVGAVESSAVAIRAIARSGWDLALVITLPLENSERHSDFVDLGSDAAAVGADVHRTSQVNNAATLAAIRAAQPDYVFVVGWSQICGPDFLDVAPGRVIGYHPAALPRMRGRAALAWTILLDEKITAGTLFWMASGVDDGPILEQQYFHVAPRETTQSLYNKHMVAIDEMLGRALPRLAAGNAKQLTQDEACATYAARRTADDGLVDWSQSAVEIDRLVRAAGRPYPGAFTWAKGAKLTIWSAQPIVTDLLYHARPGQLLTNNDEGFVVQTGDGRLLVTDWSWEAEGRIAIHSLLGGTNG